jgi:RsiW-degrading membrane proteinase PrsW (M82 family)
MPWTSMMEFLESWFKYPGLEWKMALVAAGLAVLFGIIWLLGYWPPVFKKAWFWPLMIGSAAVTLLAITFIQIPAQYYTNQAFADGFATETLMTWYLLVGLPMVLISGLVQEAAKSLPVAIWWWSGKRTFTPKMGLIIGAAAGAGFGIFEAFWVHAQVFASGWTTQVITQYGFDGILPFWERLFTIGLHTGASALVGYGLAKGKWWKYYLVATVLHALLNYSNIVINYLVYVRGAAWFKYLYAEFYIAFVALATMAAVMYLRWRKDRQEPGMPSDAPLIPFAPAEPATPGPIVSIDMRTPPGAE